jgi:hypothetical protein
MMEDAMKVSTFYLFNTGFDVDLYFMSMETIEGDTNKCVTMPPMAIAIASVVCLSEKLNVPFFRVLCFHMKYSMDSLIPLVKQMTYIRKHEIKLPWYYTMKKNTNRETMTEAEEEAEYREEEEEERRAEAEAVAMFKPNLEKLFFKYQDDIPEAPYLKINVHIGHYSFDSPIEIPESAFYLQKS